MTFKKKLEEEYAFNHVSLLDFATALSNVVKCDIFNVLSRKPSQSLGDLSYSLGYGQRELEYNVRQMLKSGLLKTDHIRGRQKYYKINKTFLQVVSQKLSHVL